MRGHYGEAMVQILSLYHRGKSTKKRFFRYTNFF